jgi:hypothetical protein
MTSAPRPPAEPDHKEHQPRVHVAGARIKGSGRIRASGTVIRASARRNQPINASALRRSGHRRAPGARPVRQSGSRRTTSRSAGGGDSPDGESEPAGGRPTDLELSPRARELAREFRAHSRERVARWRHTWEQDGSEQLSLDGGVAS